MTEQTSSDGPVAAESETHGASAAAAGEGASASGASGASGDSGDSGEGPAVVESAPVDPLQQAKSDAERYRDQLLRTAADFDNFRKRTRRELEDAQRRGKEGAVKELLPVFDNLERALTMGDQNDAKAIVDGLRIILRQFETTLEKVGITRIETVGKPFDPNVHEAIQHMSSSDVPAGCIAAEVQAGYKLGDYLLRAAMVVVSKGPDAAS